MASPARHFCTINFFLNELFLRSVDTIDLRLTASRDLAQLFQEFSYVHATGRLKFKALFIIPCTSSNH